MNYSLEILEHSVLYYGFCWIRKCFSWMWWFKVADFVSFYRSAMETRTSVLRYSTTYPNQRKGAASGNHLQSHRPIVDESLCYSSLPRCATLFLRHVSQLRAGRTSLVSNRNYRHICPCRFDPRPSGLGVWRKGLDTVIGNGAVRIFWRWFSPHCQVLTGKSRTKDSFRAWECCSLHPCVSGR